MSEHSVSVKIAGGRGNCVISRKIELEITIIVSQIKQTQTHLTFFSYEDSRKQKYVVEV